MKKTLLVISHDKIGRRMAGVGIRYYEVARALAKQGFQVTLAAPIGSHLPVPRADEDASSFFFVTVPSLDSKELHDLVKEHLAVLAHPEAIWSCRQVLEEEPVFVVVDGYDITLFEQLELDSSSQGNSTWIVEYHRRLRFVLKRGDFFVTATERQRDFWLGLLAGAGRVDGQIYRADPSLRNLIDLLPYGFPDHPPRHTRSVMRNVVPGIGEDDFIVLWGGGAWQWLDPVTLVKAASAIAKQRQDVKFFFPGLSHPAPELVAAMPIQAEVVAMSERLGLKDKVIFFGEWADYEDWQNYLLESNCGVSLHRDHVEARFAARTRVMGYLWADLPMILTSGDEWSEEMARLGLANLVQPEDAQAVAEAILELAEKGGRAASRLSEVEKSKMKWSSCVKVLQKRLNQVLDQAELKAISREESRFSGLSLVEMDDPKADPQMPTVPRPRSVFARLIHPLIRASVLWYLESIVAQQNLVNAHLVDRLRQCESRLIEQESRLIEQESRLIEQESRLVRQQSALIETNLLLSDLAEQ